MKQRNYRSILITGGAGFIGSYVLKRILRSYPNSLILNLDALTYAGNLENIKECEAASNYKFVKGNINSFKTIQNLFNTYNFDAVINLAAESHVDNSISEPSKFVHTNVNGTFNLLEAARQNWNSNFDSKCFYQISTDEVFGSLEFDGLFNELSRYDPRSPYSASKASSDHMARSYFYTYNLPVIISNCSNNYGPNQHQEKLIPLMIKNIFNHKPLPIYGKGDNIRDWLFVEDHAEAIDLILQKGKIGETYLIGGENEQKNIVLVLKIIDFMDKFLNRPDGSSRNLIRFVEDRKGHDFRYAIDASKIRNDLGWCPKTDFDNGLKKTIISYLDKLN